MRKHWLLNEMDGVESLLVLLHLQMGGGVAVAARKVNGRGVNVVFNYIEY